MTRSYFTITDWGALLRNRFALRSGDVIDATSSLAFRLLGLDFGVERLGSKVALRADLEDGRGDNEPSRSFVSLFEAEYFLFPGEGVDVPSI